MKNVFLVFVVLFGLSSASAIAGSCSTGSCGPVVVRSGVRTTVRVPVRVFRGVRSRVGCGVSTRQNRRSVRRAARVTRSSRSGRVARSCSGCAG